MFRAVTTVVLSILAGIPAQGQTPAGAPAFEVASIKPSDPAAHGMSIQRNSGGRFTTTNVPLRRLIAFAWDLRDHQLTGGPNWLDSESFDIIAKPDREIPVTEAGGEILKAMVRSLIADRFKLTFHTETRELPIYSLVLAKSGSKLTPSSADANGPSMRGGRNQLACVKVNMSLWAKSLGGQLGRTVVDNTGLKGDFDFTLKWAPDPGMSPGPGKGGEQPPPDAADSDSPSIFTALQEQLGLKLEPAKGPVEIFVVDHAEKPSEN